MNSLSSETKNLLNKYFDAASNLYGIIRLSALLKIYNSQNDPVTQEDFLDFVSEISNEKKFYYIVGEDEFFADVDECEPIERDLVAEYLLIDDDDLSYYYNVKKCQEGKPYYVPVKEKLLKYSDEYYYEKTLSFISFRAFLRNQTGISRERADILAEDVYLSANVSLGDLEDAIGWVESNGYELSDDKIEEFFRLFLDMYSDTRLHIYRGHTYNEIYGTV